MKLALVTGATGFIGHHLVRKLVDQGVEARCLVRPTSATDRLADLGAELVVGDVTDADSVKAAARDVDVVFHLAGLTKTLQPSQLWSVNEAGSRNVAQACVAGESPPVLIAVSSLAASGPSVDGRPREETDPPAPVSNYGRSKLAGEEALRPTAEAVPTTIVRPPIVLGEGDRDGLEMFLAIARFGLHFVPGPDRGMFSLIHAGDLAQALWLTAIRGRRLTRAETSAGIYFAAAEETVRYGDLGRMIGAALGRPNVRVVKSPAAGVWGIAAVNEAVARIRRRPHILSFDKAREAVAGGWACSTEAIRRDVDFRPACPLQERLEQTARWYIDQGWLPARRRR